MNSISGQIGKRVAWGLTKETTYPLQVSEKGSGTPVVSVEDNATILSDGLGEKRASASSEKPPVVKDPSTGSAGVVVPVTTRKEEPLASIAVMEEAKPLDLSEFAAPSQTDTRHRKAHSGAPEQQSAQSFIPGPKARLVHTETTVKNMAKISRSIRIGEHVLLEGPTGSGKTSLVKYLAHLTNNPLRRINLSNSTDITEIIGGFVPAPDGSFKWKDGIVTEAMRKGQWLLLDELNLADPGILERLNSVFDDRTIVVTEGGRTEVIEAHPNFRVFATMNPVTYAGRKELSDAMKNRLHRIWIDDMKPQDMVEIVSKQTDINDKLLIQMAMLHKTIADMAANDRNFKKGGPYPFTLRDLQKWVRRVDAHKNEDRNITSVVWDLGRRIYIDRFSDPTVRKSVEDIFRVTFDDSNKPPDAPTKMEKGSDGVFKIGRVKLPPGPGGPYVPGPKAELVNTRDTVEKLYKLAQCVEVDEPVLMVGPTAAGKTSLVKYLGRLTNNNVRRFNLSQQTDTTEFIGGYVPVEGKPGKFAWKDGILVEAMKRGDWIIFDEINLAEPSILERINSLLDPDRSLVLTEKENEEVKAHPNCRIFATMNPASYAGRKELSLAWRNRFTEMWIPEIVDPAQLKEIVETWLAGVPEGKGLADRMVDFHINMKQMTASKEIGASQRGGFIYTLRNLLSFSQYIKGFREEEGVAGAFLNGAMHCYADEMVNEEDVKKVEALAKKYVPEAK